MGYYDETVEMFVDGNLRTRMVCDDMPRDPLQDWEHGVTVIPVSLPSYTREDYYTANDHTEPAEIFEALLYRMRECGPHGYGPMTIEERREGIAYGEDYTHGGLIDTLEDVLEVFKRITGLEVAHRTLHGSMQGEWAEVVAFAADDDANRLDYLHMTREEGEHHMRGEVYGIVLERLRTYTADDGSGDEVHVWGEVESCWGYVGYEYALDEAEGQLRMARKHDERLFG